MLQLRRGRRTVTDHVTRQVLTRQPLSSSGVTLDFSVIQLLRVLNEKIGVEYNRVRETCVSPGVASIAVLEAEVRAP